MKAYGRRPKESVLGRFGYKCIKRFLRWKYLLASLVFVWGTVYETVNGHEHRTRVGKKKLPSHTEQNSQTEGPSEKGKKENKKGLLSRLCIEVYSIKPKETPNQPKTQHVHTCHHI